MSIYTGKGLLGMLGENPLVSLDVREMPYLWTARLARFGHNLYRCAIRESAAILEQLSSGPEIKVLLHDDLRGVVMALSGHARILSEADPQDPGKVVVEIALDPA